MPVTIIRTFKFETIEDLQDIVPDNRSEVVQLEKGKMSGSVVHLELPGLGISAGDFARAAEVKGVVSETRHCLGTLLASDGPAFGHRNVMAPGDIVVVAPGVEREATFRSATKYIACMVEPDRLRQHLDPDPGAYERLQRHRVGVMSADPEQARTNIEELLGFLDMFLEHGRDLPDYMVEFYVRGMLEKVTEPFTGFENYCDARPLSNEGLVKRVEEYLEAHQTVHVSQICEALRVARTTLFRAFREVKQMSPKAYNRCIRLGRVRTSLLRGEYPGIREAAFAHGFCGDQSKFAQEYRRQFDELPSTTAQRGQTAEIREAVRRSQEQLADRAKILRDRQRT